MPLQDKSRKLINLPGRKLEKLIDELLTNSNNESFNSLTAAGPILMEIVQIDINKVISTSESIDLNTLFKNPELDIFNIQQLADIFYTMAADLHLTDEEAENLYRQCKNLYQYVQQNNSEYSMEIHLKMQNIQNFLGE